MALVHLTQRHEATDAQLSSALAEGEERVALAEGDRPLLRVAAR
jgi:hypothetical protein